MTAPPPKTIQAKIRILDEHSDRPPLNFEIYCGFDIPVFLAEVERWLETA